MTTALFAIVFAVSLCADCFAVSLCSSVTLKSVAIRHVATVALAFAVVQTSFLLGGWAIGDILSGFIGRFAELAGFTLLAYVGGSMLLEGLKSSGEVKDLNGFRNIILGGVATSIDALAAGASLSMESKLWGELWPLALAVFVVTALSVVAGVYGGKTIGSKVGRVAEITGGCVLIGIGIGFLI